MIRTVFSSRTGKIALSAVAAALAIELATTATQATPTDVPARISEPTPMLGGYYSELYTGPSYGRYFYSGAYGESANLVYQHAREMLVQGNYRKAADLFLEVVDDYPKVGQPYAAEALYWRAYSLQQLGTAEDLKQAKVALEQHRKLLDQQKEKVETSLREERERSLASFENQRKQLQESTAQQAKQQEEAIKRQQEQTRETLERMAKSNAEQLARMKEQQESMAKNQVEQNERFRTRNSLTATGNTQQLDQMLANIEKQKQRSAEAYQEQLRRTETSYAEQQDRMRKSEVESRKRMEESLQRQQESRARSLETLKERQEKYLPSLEKRREEYRELYDAQYQRLQKLERKIGGSVPTP